MNASLAIQHCADKNFSKISPCGKWVTMEAKSPSKNDSLRKDVRMLILLKRSAVVHPGKSRIVDILEKDCEDGDDNTPAKMTLEYIQPFGFDLCCLMIKQEKTGKVMPMASVAHYFYQVCEGLAFMHTAGVIHGDVKLQNVLVTPAGDIKIIDFGETIAVGQKGLFGSSHYMAPEARGCEAVADPAIDIYCLGVVGAGLSQVLADGDKARINVTVRKCRHRDPKQRMKLQDLMNCEEWSQPIHYTDDFWGSIRTALRRNEKEGDIIRTRTSREMTMDALANYAGDELKNLFPISVRVQDVSQEWLSSRDYSTVTSSISGDPIAKCRLKGFARQITDKDVKDGDTIGNTKLMQQGIHVLYVERKNGQIEKVPGFDTKIELGDWIYFGIAMEERQLYQDTIDKAMDPDKEDPSVFPVYLSFSEVDLPKEIDGYVLGPDMALPQYENLPERPQGYLNLRNQCKKNLAGVRRDGIVLPFPGPAFMLKKGDKGLFVQAHGADGRLKETHNLDSIPDSFRAAVRASQASWSQPIPYVDDDSVKVGIRAALGRDEKDDDIVKTRSNRVMTMTEFATHTGVNLQLLCPIHVGDERKLGELKKAAEAIGATAQDIDDLIALIEKRRSFAAPVRQTRVAMMWGIPVLLLSLGLGLAALRRYR